MIVTARVRAELADWTAANDEAREAYAEHRARLEGLCTRCSRRCYEGSRAHLCAACKRDTASAA